VLMPEASVDQNDFPQPRKYQVWRARQIAAMQPKAIAQPVRRRPHGQLRLCVGLANAPHLGAAGFGRKKVWHTVAGGLIRGSLAEELRTRPFLCAGFEVGVSGTEIAAQLHGLGVARQNTKIRVGAKSQSAGVPTPLATGARTRRHGCKIYGPNFADNTEKLRPDSWIIL